jgi:hypothetical protein
MKPPKYSLSLQDISHWLIEPTVSNQSNYCCILWFHKENKTAQAAALNAIKYHVWEKMVNMNDREEQKT